MPISRSHRTGRRAATSPGYGRALQRRGFTLTELLVVSVIVLSVTLMAVGAYANLRRSRTVKTAAEAVQAAFVAARAYAITTNGTYRVVIQMRDPSMTSSQVSYWIDEIYRGDDSPPFSNVPSGAKTPKLSTPALLPEDVDLFDVTVTQTRPVQLQVTGSATTADFATVRFFPDGWSDAAEVRLVRDGELTADATNPHAYAIRMAPATAKSKIVAAELQ